MTRHKPHFCRFSQAVLSSMLSFVAFFKNMDKYNGVCETSLSICSSLFTCQSCVRPCCQQRMSLVIDPSIQPSFAMHRVLWPALTDTEKSLGRYEKSPCKLINAKKSKENWTVIRNGLRRHPSHIESFFLTLMSHALMSRSAKNYFKKLYAQNLLTEDKMRD